MLPWTAAFAAPAPSPAATPNVVGRDGLPPDLSAPAGLLDDGAGVTGIGQMAIDVGGGSVDLCTGTLINPRTVIFAAHCVNARPAADYGSARGGVALSFGFGTDNLTAVIEWLGNGGAAEAHRTNAAQALFNVEQVWYDPRSLALGPQESFLQADIALATVDTPAAGIPTWALLFSPLTSPQQALLVGYGGRGTGASGDIGIDFRRRAAENMVSLLGSLDDVDRALIGFSPGVHPQSLYQLDFDDPAFGTPQASAFDFNLFGGPALAREGITASGDSGSPLIIDKAFSRPVVAGTLSGSRTYFPGQPSAGYGTSTFYQPLFLFWDVIVANNPYRYVTNRPAVGDWTDPAHWVQQMDPNYTVLQNGQLKTGLPGTRAQGVSGDTVKFGQVCSFDHCEQLSGNPGASQSAQPIPGGPGSTGFVPDNMAGTRAAQARYYDVTLSAPGLTRLAADIDIDRLTLDGATILDVRKGGSLTVVGDFFQRLGWTNIDGAVRTGEALFVDGVLSGSGLFDPGYATFARAAIAPGGPLSIGTLTIAGDVIFSSGTSLFVDLNRKAADRLAVVADQDNAGSISLGGTVTFAPAQGPKPRHGQVFTFITAEGGVSGTFDKSNSLLPGVLKAELGYRPDAVTATLKAGSLLDLAKSLDGVTQEVLHFASALDGLRGKSYGKLYNLYGSIDLMDGVELDRALRKLAPKGKQAQALREAQNDAFTSVLRDRLSDLAGGGGSAAGLSIIGSPDALLRLSGGMRAGHHVLTLSSAGSAQRIGNLPEGLSGFVAFGTRYGGSSESGASSRRSTDGLRSWQFAVGLERQLADRLTLGMAAATSDGRVGAANPDSSTAATSRQIALYGSYRLGQSAYVAGVAALSRSSSEQVRTVAGFDFQPRISASPEIRSLDVSAEAGLNLAIRETLTLTPRISLRQVSGDIGAYREQGGEAALSFDRQRFARTESRAGFKLAGGARPFAGWSFRSQAQVDWVNRLGGGYAPVTARFAAAPDMPILLSGADADPSWAEVRGGLGLTNGILSIGLSVDARLASSDLDEDRALVRFGFLF
jgi:uncharacterized protein with beta-barrel porin domain